MDTDMMDMFGDPADRSPNTQEGRCAAYSRGRD